MALFRKNKMNNKNTDHRVMQPFFTTKPTGEGAGLGLSLSYDIVVKGHGGTIIVKSEVGNGTTFTVTIPVNLNSKSST
jgi:signal transduction histidine kinase